MRKNALILCLSLLLLLTSPLQAMTFESSEAGNSVQETASETESTNENTSVEDGGGEGETPTDGETPSDGEAPVDGEAPTDGETPSDGETPTDGEMPGDGETPTDGETPGDGETPTDDETPSDGEMPADGEPPTDGETPTDGVDPALPEDPALTDAVEGEEPEAVFEGTAYVTSGAYLEAWAAADEEILWEGGYTIYGDEKAEFVLWAEPLQPLEGIAGFRFSVTVSGVLSYESCEILVPGFELKDEPVWTETADGWQTVLEMNSMGDGMAFAGKTPLMKLCFSLTDAQTAAFRIDSADALLLSGEFAAMAIPEEAAVCMVGLLELENVDDYAAYDLNKDDMIDFLDVSIALRAIDRTDMDEGWAVDRYYTDECGGAVTAAMIDVNQSGAVDMLDVNDIISNYKEQML